MLGDGSSSFFALVELCVIPVTNGWSLGGRLPRLGQAHPEARSPAHLAFYFHRSVHELDQVLDDGQAEPRAAHLPRSSRIDAVKALEDARLVRRGDAGPVVA